jgi:hypothetical protein
MHKIDTDSTGDASWPTLHRLLSELEISSQDKKANKIALNNLSEYFKTHENEMMEAKNIGEISDVVLHLYLSKLSLMYHLGTDEKKLFSEIFQKKESPDTEGRVVDYMQTVSKINACLGSALNVFTQSPIPDELPTFIFERLLANILSDNFEEVIGQERDARAFRNMLFTQVMAGFDYQNPTQELSKTIFTAAAQLYPAALLVAHLDDRSPIPSAEHQEESLAADTETFVREYKYLFGPYCDEKTWKPERFKELLKNVWEYTRALRESKQSS